MKHFLASKRPNSLLVTPKRFVSCSNDWDPPGSSLPLSAFYFQDGILPVGLHGDSGSIMQSLHGHEFCLGLKDQVGFKEE